MATLSATEREPVTSSIEDNLLERARLGERTAFQMIFERHGPAVSRYLRDLFGDAAAADEATQETFVRAHSRLGTLREADRLRSWLLGIAHRVFLEQCRRRRTEAGVADRVEVEPLPTPATPELEMLGREADAVLASALGRLTEERRSALLMRLDHGLSYEQIAEEMTWPVAKVKNEIHRARLQLRSYLASYVGGAS